MKLAFITPRYGAEIPHGGEHACRRLAEQLVARHDIDVLTTCARDAATWKNDSPEGADRVRGVLVRRFATTGGRDADAFAALSRRVFGGAHSRADELDWLKRSGTSSPGLVDFLRRQHRNYDALVFFSYASGTTLQGLAVAPERSVLFPAASLDPALRLWVVHDALNAAAALGYASAAERRLVRAHVRRIPRAEEIVGVGIATVPDAEYPRLNEGPADAEAGDEEVGPAAPDEAEEPPPHLGGRGVIFRRRHRLHGRLALYAGAVAADNGTEELIEYFDAYAAQDADAAAVPALVMLGVKMMRLPPEPWLRPAGVLPERDRLAALAAADVALAPDPDDLLGERALEGLAAGTPVLASARNAAAVEHVRRSNGGLYYANREEFVAAMRLLMSNDRLREAIGDNGRRYVQQHYRWDAVLARFERLLSRVKGGGRG